MKILMLANRETTWIGSFFDHLYVGLRSLLSSDSVHVYPYLSVYSTDLPADQLCFITWNLPNRSKTLEEIVELVKSDFYDLIVIGMILCEEVQEDYLEIIGNSSCPIAVINSSDFPRTWDFKDYLKKSPLVEFRKESFNIGTEYEAQSHGMRFDFATDSFPEKRYDVCAIFGGKPGSPIGALREKIVKKIKDIFPGSISLYDPALSFSEYMAYYRQAWIGLSVRGIGIHTGRVYEIIAAKSFCVSDLFPIVVPDWFIEHDHIEYYDNSDLDSMEATIRILLSDKAALKEKILEAYGHLWTYHNIYHNAERFLSVVRRKLK